MSGHGTLRRTPICTLLRAPVDGAPVIATGWVKTSRFSKNVSFVHLFDGSSPDTVQVVLTAEQAEAHKNDLSIGASVRVVGRWAASPAAGQPFEIAAETVEILGQSDATTYPIQRKATSFEHLRTIAHLRPRTNTFQSVFRLRNQLAWQIHRFFQERGFMWVHTPIIASSDCEGAGEMFEVRAGDAPEGFFGGPTYLTVSGQLEVETFAQAFTDVYTFGPTFRAENSNTVRHANEFWMIEPEMAWSNLDDVIALAEDFVRTVARETMKAIPNDFDFFDQRIEKGLIDALNAATAEPFARITYSEAQEILAKSGHSFQYPIGWGESLQSEHERFLAEQHFKRPVFVTDYPIEQKSFYMRVSDDRRTVAATDLLVPRIGEMIGGSQREERLDMLEWHMAQKGIDAAPYWWYLDLRRFGSTPHGGFGLGFERLIMWMSGMQNIRDVLPFPRTPGSAAF